ncbi:MAG: transposase [Sedimentisphaerales bacterium]
MVTDQASYYDRMRNLLPHKSVDHSVMYCDGWIHTNSIESFWALLKRGIVGQFHKVSVKHLPKYLNEFSYRFNNRDNGNVFGLTIQKGLGVM